MSLTDDFVRLYGADPALFRAPGRVNLIGEHTDYNDGFVMPAALNLDTKVAVAPRSDRQLRFASREMGESPRVFDLDALPTAAQGQWSDYPLGVAVTLAARGIALRGADLMVSSTVPLGAGLSSSAALEVATALALLHAAGVEMPSLALAQLCQQAENAFVGVPCGIMDMYASALGKAGHALLIDCRALTAQPLPLPSGVSIIISNSGVRHALGSGEYALRRQDCEAGVRALQQWYPEVRALRDVQMWQLDDHRGDLDPRVYRRCRHVIGENDRVQAAAAALNDGNLALFGALMGASHDSLRDDYEVSCRELDILVEIATDAEGVLGARMTGGGFGGCTVSLVEDGAVDHFIPFLAREYRRLCERETRSWRCQASAGAGPV